MRQPRPTAAPAARLWLRPHRGGASGERRGTLPQLIATRGGCTLQPSTSEKSGWLSARLQLQEIVQEQSHAGLHHKTGNPGGGEREGKQREGKQREGRGKAAASCSGWAPQPGPHGSHGAGAAPNVGPGAPRGQQAGGGRWGSPRAVFCSALPFRSALEIPPSFRRFVYASQPAEPFGLLCGLGFFGVVFVFF